MPKAGDENSTEFIMIPQGSEKVSVMWELSKTTVISNWLPV